MGRVPIALQLYSVRGECDKDFAATLESVKGIGYEAVELCGFSGSRVEWSDRSPKELRKLLHDNGLACCGMHLGTAALLGDSFAHTVELNGELGNQFLIVAADKERMSSEAGIAELAAILTETAGKLRPLGMFTGYHAHPFDFVRFGDRTAWDILFGSTPDEVIMQLDIGNSANGGGDPVGILRKFPRRARTVHLKEYGGAPGSVIGQGSADWKEIFRLCEETQRTEWYIVEEGGPDGMGFDVSRRSFEQLRAMGR